MVVVDCNVVVHLLLEGEETPRARALLGRDADWHSEALLMFEFVNVLATAPSSTSRGLPIWLR